MSENGYIVRSLMENFKDSPDMPMDYLITQLCLDYYKATVKSYQRSLNPIPDGVQRMISIVRHTYLNPKDSCLTPLLEEEIKLRRIDNIL